MVIQARCRRWTAGRGGGVREEEVIEKIWGGEFTAMELHIEEGWGGRAGQERPGPLPWVPRCRLELASRPETDTQRSGHHLSFFWLII